MVGKGVSAALLMSAVKASFRAHADTIDSVGEIMHRVNEAMCRDSAESEFATLWAGQIDPETMVLRSTSAGHEPPVLVRDGELMELPTGGLVVGVMPGQVYEEVETPLRAGDVLVGILGAYLALTRSLPTDGWGPFEATLAAVHVHGLAGDLAAERLGRRAVTASSITEHLCLAQQRFEGDASA